MKTKIAKPESRWLHTSGYVLVYAPHHPRATRGRIFEHILVAEEKYGRPIRTDEHVHHKDGNKQNNHPDNLQVLTNSEHQQLHSKGRRKKRKE